MCSRFKKKKKKLCVPIAIGIVSKALTLCAKAAIFPMAIGKLLSFPFASYLITNDYLINVFLFCAFAPLRLCVSIKEDPHP